MHSRWRHSVLAAARSSSRRARAGAESVGIAPAGASGPTTIGLANGGASERRWYSTIWASTGLPRTSIVTWSPSRRSRSRYARQIARVRCSPAGLAVSSSPSKTQYGTAVPLVTYPTSRPSLWTLACARAIPRPMTATCRIVRGSAPVSEKLRRMIREAASSWRVSASRPMKSPFRPVRLTPMRVSGTARIGMSSPSSSGPSSSP